jgi:hypothetical protein
MKIKDARMKSKLLSAIALIVLCGCNKPSPEEVAKSQTEFDARKAEECRDKICEGDVEPKRNIKTEAIVKLNNQFFIGPSAYFSNGSPSTAFYWPSKTPVNTPRAEKNAPELVPSGPGRISNFSDVAIEVFLRSNPNPPAMLPRYQALQEAEKDGRVLGRKKIHSSLDEWRVKEGQLIYLKYVAINLKDASGHPPVLSCLEQNDRPDFCTMAFGWESGISADLRFSGKHSVDWPEIYQETIRVLSLLRRTKRVSFE